MESNFGKIGHSAISDVLLGKLGYDNPSVTTGPGFGVDVALVNLGNNQSMALTSDPLSLIPSLGLVESAWLSVHLMANDMATTGFAPQFGQFVLNLPETLSSADFKTYWDYINGFCKQIGVAITGGHTGFVHGQNSTIAGGGTFITIAQSDKILTSKGAKPGDVILVTKYCGLSSSAILAMSFPNKVIAQAGREAYQHCCESFYQTSSLKDALTAVSVENHGVTAMHDVTEGGVLGAIYELAIASNNGVNIYSDKLPKNEMANQVLKAFDLDERFCIGAGAMVICCKPNNVKQLLDLMHQNSIECSVVGEVTPLSEGIQLIENDISSAMPYFEKDPYWLAYTNAITQQWA